LKKYKLLYIGAFEGYWVSDNYRKNGFKKVFDTETFDYRIFPKNILKMTEMLVKKFNEFKPNIVFMNKCELMPPIIIDRLRKNNNDVMFLYFNGDQRGMPADEASNMCSVVDAVLINNKHKKQWEQYYELGTKCIYEYHSATDIDSYFPMNSKKIYDIVFVGGQYGCRFPLSKF